MARVLVLNTDMSSEMRDIRDNDLHKIVDGFIEVVTLVKGSRLAHIIGIAVDDEGLRKQLPVNRLATSIRGMFHLPVETPLVGTAVLFANSRFDSVDLPQVWIDLVQALKAVVE